MHARREGNPCRIPREEDHSPMGFFEAMGYVLNLAPIWYTVIGMSPPESSLDKAPTSQHV